MRTYAQLTTSFVVFVNRVGVEESISFWGGSEVIGPDGAAVFSAPLYDEGLYPVDVDLAEVRRARIGAAAPARRAARARGPRARPDRRRAGRAGDRTRPPTTEPSPASTSRHAGTSIAAAMTSADVRAPDRARDRHRRRPPGHRRVHPRPAPPGRASSGPLVGLSGGIDSALVAYLVAEAIGADRLLCVLMPYRTSSPASRADAEEVVRRLGCASELVDISPMVDGYFGTDAERRRARAGGPRGQRAPARQLHGPDADGRPVRPIGDLARARRRDRQQDRVAHRLHDPVRRQRVARSTRSATCTRARSASWRRRSACPTRSSPRRRRPTCGRARPTSREAGFSYPELDRLLFWLVDKRRSPEELVAKGFPAERVEWATRAVAGAEFKRQVPPIAKLGPRTAGIDYLYPRRRPGSTRS